jgi:hypothetical protein
MKSDAKRKPAQANGPNRRADKEYVEFQLDPATLLEVEALASKTGCTPFQMSVTLLREELSRISAE